jgi:hypothetical protein
MMVAVFLSVIDTVCTDPGHKVNVFLSVCILVVGAFTLLLLT